MTWSTANVWLAYLWFKVPIENKKRKWGCRPASSSKIVYTLRFLWTALVGNNWRERCCHSVLLRILNIIYSLFGIGTSASRDCSIIPFLFLCAAVSLSPFPIKEPKKKKKEKMIATILEPGNQVIDWSSRTLDLCSRQGFSFSPAWKTKAPMPCFSSNTCRSLAFLAAWQQEIHATFAFPAAMLQRGEKKPWHSKNVNAPICLNSALEKNKHKTKLTRDPRGKMKQVLRFDVTKHNSSEEWTGRRVDVVRAVRWCCMDALVCVNLGPVKDAFTRALSHLPTPSNPKDGSPPQERRCYLYPLSILVPTRIS